LIHFLKRYYALPSYVDVSPDFKSSLFIWKLRSSRE